MDIDSLSKAQSSGQAAMAQISVAVTRQIQDSQEVMANALVGMIQQSTNLSKHQFKQSGLGDHIDISV